ncbi:hypothetical protein Lal_00020031 [Lupinus albus]|nr:hypothetical protein Lal_00020031 [Lupinus albus]
MDFDEYDYLEKTVEEKDNNNIIKKDNTERSYRKRDEFDDDHDANDKKSKRSRRDDENGSSKKDGDNRDHKRSSGRDKERDRERERSSGRDKERERDRERSSGRDKERRRERDREGDKESERSIREKDREREKDRDREKERDRREKDKEKEREKSRERREREKSREERERSRRSRSRSEFRDKELEPDFESRDGRRYREKKEAVEPEADPERDQRTVFAYQMPLKATERDVYEFFSKAGKVRDVRLIMDRNSRRSRGVGLTFSLYESDTSKETQLDQYIEFYDAMSVPMAIALCGQLLLGQPVMVKPSEAEKNLVQSNATGGAAGVVGPYGAVDRKLYVGNLHFSMTESQLREIFESFGPVELVQLPLDLETGHCKGFGFIQFSHLEHAKAAQTINGKLEIAGRTIKVSSVTDHVGSQDTTAKSADFDDDEGGLSLNAQSRAMLMQKLDRSGLASSIGLPIVNGSAPAQQAISLPIGNPGMVPATVLPSQFMPTPVAEPVGNPSECLLLKNMFDPMTETEPDFDLDIKDDVQEECSKHGRVKHIYVDKRSAGFVYLRFETVEAASAAQREMHNRWFARRLISAVYMVGI